jgi:hypothetical protein
MERACELCALRATFSLQRPAFAFWLPQWNQTCSLVLSKGQSTSAPSPSDVFVVGETSKILYDTVRPCSRGTRSSSRLTLSLYRMRVKCVLVTHVVHV